MNLVAALWHLQVTDQEIDEKTKRARQVEDALANDPTVVAARAAHAAAQKQLGELRGLQHDRELEAKGLETKTKEIEQRLYSGRVTSPRELEGLDRDLQMHKRQRSALDDKLLELMEAVEQAQARANDAARALEQAEAKRAHNLEQMERERAGLSARLAELAADRERTRAALDPGVVRQYDRLRQTKAGRAVAPLKRDACGACGVAVPTGLMSRVQAGDAVVLCPSCGRILTV